jgi:hypothetical protein
MRENDIFVMLIIFATMIISMIIVFTYLANIDRQENAYKIACMQAKGDLVWQPAREGAIYGNFVCKLKGKE